MVAPFAGAWIETSPGENEADRDDVAPFAGAWIETGVSGIPLYCRLSLPSRERGLKLRLEEWKKQPQRSLPSRERGLKPIILRTSSGNGSSLPSRERGLKLYDVPVTLQRSFVAPFAGAWIETLGWSSGICMDRSLPSRERGLKPVLPVWL